MKIYEEPIEGKKVKRVLITASYEEIEVLYGLLLKAKQFAPEFPETPESKARFQRIRNMMKICSLALGISKQKTITYEAIQCPKCPAKARGEQGLVNHLRDIHSK